MLYLICIGVIAKNLKNTFLGGAITMKEKYNNYFRWGITVITIIAFGILFFFFVFRMNSILGFLGKILSILSPIISGAAIAYLINPLVTITVCAFLTVFLVFTIYKDDDFTFLSLKRKETSHAADAESDEN